MKIKRTWAERLLSLTPWVSRRNETDSERLRRFADTMQPSRPMHRVEQSLPGWMWAGCSGNCDQGRRKCDCR